MHRISRLMVNKASTASPHSGNNPAEIGKIILPLGQPRQRCELEHFQVKWKPVHRPEMRQIK